MNVYDFDNTIYDGESILDFFLFCLKKKKCLIVYLPLLLSTTLLYKLRFLSISRLYKQASKMSKVVIHNKESATKLIDDFWKINSRKSKHS